MYEPCVLLLKRHIFEAYWQNTQQKRMVYRICLPVGETAGPIICPSEMNTSQIVPQCYPSRAETSRTSWKFSVGTFIDWDAFAHLSVY
jgi:hypothetical protein